MQFLLIALVSLAARLGATLPDSATKIDVGALGPMDAASGALEDGQGRVYVSDPEQGVVDAFQSGVRVASLQGVTAGGLAPAMTGMDMDSAGHLYVAQQAPCQVVVYNSDGSILRTMGNQPADTSNFNVASSPWVDMPNDVAVAPDGRVYVADSGHDRIAVYDANGAFLKAWGHLGYHEATDELIQPYGITIDRGLVYVADAGNARVMVYDLEGNYIKQIGRRGIDAAGLDSPFDVTVDGDENVWVADNGQQKIVVYDSQGQLLKVYGTGADGLYFEDPADLHTSADGTVSFADGYSGNVYLFETGVHYSRTGPSTPKAPAPALKDVLLAFGPVPARAGQPLQLQLPFKADRVSWDLLSLDMRRVAAGDESNSDLASTDTQGLESGVYIVRAKVQVGGESRQAIQKIIITR
jgi:DNA-binding beta-propeller fold protein YncE